MKIKLIFFCLIIHFIASSQTYQPFPIDSANWGFYKTSPSGPSYEKEIVKGDTLLGGKNYHKVYTQTNALTGFYREFSKKIYGKIIGYVDTSEILIYDYNLNVGDTFYDKRTTVGLMFNYKFVVSSIATTTLTIDSRKQYNFTFEGYQGPPSSYSNLGSSCNFFWIEGIGSLKGIFNNRANTPEGTECYHAALISNASFSTLKCFEHKNLQYMSQSCLTLRNKEFNTTANLGMSPNPTTGILNLDLKNFTSTENYSLKVVNLLGQNVMEAKLEKTLNISNLKNGIYFLKLFDKEKLITTEKIIKE
ncbi:MAG: T9SS type A sorting domain-containing protein [Bacteroidota bacterium]|nr:T9SS type A sorting domain-containing protein [Bacteroidota bacterium]